MPVTKELQKGFQCSDCGWIRSVSLETLLDRSTRTNAKVAFSAHDCSQFPLSPQLTYLKGAVSGYGRFSPPNTASPGAESH